MKRMIIKAALSPGHASQDEISRMQGIIENMKKEIEEYEDLLQDTYSEEDKQAISSIIARFKNDISSLEKKIDVASS